MYPTPICTNHHSEQPKSMGNKQPSVTTYREDTQSSVSTYREDKQPSVSTYREDEMSSSIVSKTVVPDDESISETTEGFQVVSDEQIYATIFGECIGDAVGILAKHMTQDEVKKTFLKTPALEYDEIRVSREMKSKAGDWTYNCDQMILVMHSLIDNGGEIKHEDFESKLSKWSKDGFKELGDREHCQLTKKPHEIGTSCLTRAVILGIHAWGKTEQMVDNVITICKTTHPDPRCHAAAISIAVAIRLMLHHHPNIYEKGELNVDALAERVYQYAKKVIKEDEQKSLRKYLQCKDLSKMSLNKKTDDVFKCLGAGFWALRQQDFQKALVDIISNEGDTHTNGAVAGSLLGCKLGNTKEFPVPWTRLVHIEWLGGNIARFLDMLTKYTQPQHHVGQNEEMDVSVPPAKSADNILRTEKMLTSTEDQNIVTDEDKSLDEQQNYSRKFKNLNEDITQQIRATLYGQCIGDAIGLLTEFMTEREAKDCYSGNYPLEYGNKYNDRHRCRWKEGDWTDDSDQMLLIMLSLTENEGKVDHVDFAKRMVDWMHYGFKDFGDNGGLGIGQTTYSTLSNPMFTTDPFGVAEAVWERGNRKVAPNGGVMRTSILGVHDWWNINSVKTNAMTICKTTHMDPRCQASAVAVSVAISLMLQKKFYSNGSYDVEKLIEGSYVHAAQCLKDISQQRELEWFMKVTKLDDLKLDDEHSIGYTFKCMGAGFWALKQTDFKQAITKLVMKGGDADTNCAVAGALLGCKLRNIETFPPTWLCLRHRRWLDQKIESFLDVMDKRYSKVKKNGQ